MKIDTSSYYPKSPLDDDPEMPSAESARRVEEPQAPVAEPDASEPAAAIERETREPDLPPSEVEEAITSASHILSWVLVPLLMPVYGVMLAFGLSILSFTGFGTRLAFTAIVAAFNVAIPALLVLLLKKLGFVRDVGLNEQKERFLPYVICILCLTGTALFMAYKHAPEWLTMFFLGGALVGIVEVVINRWWKISVHAAGIAGIVALLIHMMLGEYAAPATQTWLLISVGLAGLLGAARIWLGRHTLAQVLAGYAVGFAAVFFMMMLS